MLINKRLTWIIYFAIYTGKLNQPIKLKLEEFYRSSFWRIYLRKLWDILFMILKGIEKNIKKNSTND